jgi:hypothetical protein
MHQFKINGKMAFDGDVAVAQDFGTRSTTIRCLGPSEERRDLPGRVNEFNGPMFILGSYKLGVLGRARHLDDQLVPVDHGPRDDRQAWRAVVAVSAGRLDDHVPLVPGPRLDVHPRPNRERALSLSGVQPHPSLQAP